MRGIILFGLLAMALSACGGSAAHSTPTSPPLSPTVASVPTAIPTPTEASRVKDQVLALRANAANISLWGAEIKAGDKPLVTLASVCAQVPDFGYRGFVFTGFPKRYGALNSTIGAFCKTLADPKNAAPDSTIAGVIGLDIDPVYDAVKDDSTADINVAVRAAANAEATETAAITTAP